MEPARPETLYDLLRALVERTGWRTEAEAARYRQLLTELEQTAALGGLSLTITTKEAKSVERQDVRQVRDHLLGAGDELADRPDHHR